jgi:hypothetical protein
MDTALAKVKCIADRGKLTNRAECDALEAWSTHLIAAPTALLTTPVCGSHRDRFIQVLFPQ